MSETSGNKQFFGQFLLENAIISAQQLRAAVNAQQETEASRLGFRAVNAGFMASADVAQVKSAGGTTVKSFCEIAQRDSLLSEERVDTLLNSQMDESVTLGEALVGTKALDAEALGQQLEKFNSDVYKGQANLTELLAGRPNADVLEAMVGLTSEVSMKLLQVLLQAESCSSELEAVAPSEYTIYQSFKGDWSGQLRLNLSSKFMMRIGSKLLEEEALIVNKTIIDATCEFLSILTGNICAKLSTQGKTVEITAPRYVEHPKVGMRSGKQSGLSDLVGTHPFTLVRMALPDDTLELCILDRSGS